MQCNGCFTKITIDKFKYIEVSECVLKANAPKKKCPCQNCIVKVTCKTQCDAFALAVHTIFNSAKKLSYDYKAIDEGAGSSYSGRKVRPYYKRII